MNLKEIFDKEITIEEKIIFNRSTKRIRRNTKRS